MRNHTDTDALKVINASILLVALSIRYRVTKRGYSFRAPWRKDTRASVSYICTSKGFWHWTDFGTGQRGSNIDFIMLVLKVCYHEALAFLENITNANCEYTKEIPAHTFSFSTPLQEGYSARWEVTSVNDLSKNEKSKLKEFRSIDRYHASLQSISFRHTSKRFARRCLCSPNISNGYEVFSAEPSSHSNAFKTSIGPKDITLSYANRNAVITESVIDALSVMIIMDRPRLSIISMNSIHNKTRLLKYIAANKLLYDNILIALDNDNPGREVSQLLVRKLKDLGLAVYSFVYSEKDPNMQLIRNPQSYSCNRIR